MSAGVLRVAGLWHEYSCARKPLNPCRFRVDFMWLKNALSRLGLRRREEFRPLRDGAVFLAQAGSMYCIDGADDVNEAIDALSRRLPFPVSLLGVIQTRDIDAALRFWHLRFARCRRRDNWFLLSDDDIEEFRAQSWTF